MRCPACKDGHGATIRRYDAESAADHFVPRDRDPARHRQLVTHLREVLWEQDVVEVQRCGTCGFGFAVPWVSGDADFYAIAHQGDPHYPNKRWEFDVTLNVLKGFPRPLRLTEVGAGKGAFLKRLGEGYDITAADFDEGAVMQLRAQGFDVVRGSLADLVNRGDPPSDVICMFQTLEHMAGLDQVFALLRRLLKPRGSVFVSVPNADATDVQEQITGLLDMPPNHVGRWTPLAMERTAEREGFAVREIKLEPVRTMAIAGLFAVYTVNARSYERSSMDARINAIPSRPLRGAMKRAIAIRHLPRLLLKRAEYHPLTCWAHLVMRA